MPVSPAGSTLSLDRQRLRFVLKFAMGVWMLSRYGVLEAGLFRSQFEENENLESRVQMAKLLGVSANVHIGAARSVRPCRAANCCAAVCLRIIPLGEL